MRDKISFWTDNRRKNIVIALDAFLILGLLGYAIGFFIMNKRINPMDTSVSYATVEQRLFWRGFLEKIYTASSVVYILGHVIVIYNALAKKIRFSFKSVAIYFFAQVGIILLCVVPIGLFDYAYFGDYLFPLRNMMVVLSLLFVVSMFTVSHKK